MTKTKTRKTKKVKEVTSNVAKTQDGTIQITFTIPFSQIESSKNKVLKEFAKETDVSGFRKGNAPLDKIEEQVGKEKVIEKTITEILPKLLADTLNKEKITPAIYPKIELLKADENKPWEIRATTCELPQIDLGDYKKMIKGELASKQIWTPDKQKGDEKQKESSQAEKENEVIKAIIKNVKVDIPKLIIDEEVNLKLSKLLERIEKLGLNLENYLASIGKTPVTLRQEYEQQAKDSIILELVLNQIAVKENIQTTDEEVNQALTASGIDSTKMNEQDLTQQKRLIESVLKRRKTITHLSSLT